jgi:hypothetical protein
LNPAACVDDAGNTASAPGMRSCHGYQVRTTRALSSTATGTATRAEPAHARRCTARHRT